MIHREATIKYAGYDPDDLKPKSGKRVCVICDKCGRVRWVAKDSYGDLCRSCAQKGEKNHFYNKRHSTKSLKKMSDAKKGEKNPSYGKHFSHSNKTIKKISKAHIGKILSEETKQKIKETSTGRIHSEKTKRKMRKAQIGEKHWNWQGGKTSKIQRICNTIEYGEWRTSVFERDDYTCQMCGGRGGILNGHHILKVSDYPELIFEINNGITLCYDCHVYKVNHHEKEYEIELLSKIFDNKGKEIFGDI